MMFWQFGKLTYDILIPPLGKSIYQLSEQEAADYFAWFHTEQNLPGHGFASYLQDMGRENALISS